MRRSKKPKPQGEGVVSSRQTELVEEAGIRQRWAIPESARNLIIRRLVKTALGPDDRHSNIAAGNLIRADALNLQEELKAIPDKHEHNVTGQIDVRAAVVHMQQDPRYVDYLNQLALSGDGIPAIDGIQPEPGQVEAGETPGTD